MARIPVKAKKRASRPSPPVAPKRTYLKQSDVPLTSLEYALRMPQAIIDHYAGKSGSTLFGGAAA